MPTLLTTTLGQFVRELAVQLSPLPTLLAEWHLTDEQFEALQNSDGYKHELAIVAREFSELGPDAGYVYRMKALSEIFIKDVVNIMNDPETPRATKVELIKFAADMGRLKAPMPVAGQQLQPQGPSVIFQFGAGLPIQSMKVVGEMPVEVPEAATVPVLTARKGFQIE